MAPERGAEQGGTRTAAQRVFFALWPDAETGKGLERLALQAHRIYGGRRMRRDNLHVTLTFIGGIEASRIAELEAIAAAIKGEPFDLVFDHTGYWRHNRIVWTGCDAIPPALQALADVLSAALRDAGYRLEQRPFAPHMTLLRNAARRDPASLATAWASTPPVWPVRDFVLVRSRLEAEGAHYDIIGRWPLLSQENA